MNNNIKVVYILSAAFMGGATISFMNMISGLMKKLSYASSIQWIVEQR